jgi:TonB family protein
VVPRFLLRLLPAVLATTLAAADKPVVFNNTTDPDDPLDRAVRQAFAEQFTVENTSVTAGFVPPRPKTGSLPRYARSPEGDTLEGYVLLGYVVTAEGRAVEPRVLKSTDERLNATATKSLEGWVFVPPSLKGKPVASTAAQEFHFTTAETAGFETTNVVLFQKDAVLQSRLDGPGRLAAAIEKIQQAVGELFATKTEPATVNLLFLVQPDGSSRLWITGTGLDTAAQLALRKSLAGLPGLAVTKGPVAFAVCGSVAGAATTEFPALPQEWEKAGAKPDEANLTDELLNTIGAEP